MEPFPCKITELSHLFSLLPSLVSRLVWSTSQQPPEVSQQGRRYHLCTVREKASVCCKTEFL